eukprot:sb/3469234/
MILAIGRGEKEIVNPFTDYMVEPCEDCFYQRQWITMTTCGPALLGIFVFAVLLIYIVLYRLKHIWDIYLTVLVYALSTRSYSTQVHRFFAAFFVSPMTLNNVSPTVPAPPIANPATQWEVVPNPFTGDYDWDDTGGSSLPPSINWTGGGNSSGEVAESQGFLWVTMVTSIPSLLGIALFSVLLIYIILKKLGDIMELYLSVLAYATSQTVVSDVSFVGKTLYLEKGSNPYIESCS